LLTVAFAGRLPTGDTLIANFGNAISLKSIQASRHAQVIHQPRRQQQSNANPAGTARLADGNALVAD
jgi:hypothetical protein